MIGMADPADLLQSTFSAERDTDMEQFESRASPLSRSCISQCHGQHTGLVDIQDGMGQTGSL